ncbi:CidA/LrgA family protein [Ferrimonas balearica]|uniref:CidA/LrgA family protein n=1 Tax=Ferrimonas balearica TaxID=44012 RepID=UPI001C5839BF|nr:CidA/LrgA family protein [Ferrimonas balearica]MBW3140085.1 CidA/LrgA family protein [Ferrimonas balearica]
MQTLFGFTALLGFWLLGEGLSHAFDWPVPGSVIGLLMLFALLCGLGRVPASIAEASDGLLRYLALLFVPAGVGVMVYGDQLLAAWLPTTIAVLAATMLTLLVSAGVMAATMRLKRGRQ